jgi:hypothetical protein
VTLELERGGVEGVTLELERGGVEGVALELERGGVEGVALELERGGVEGVTLGFADGELIGDGVVCVTGIAAGFGGEVACVTGVTGVSPESVAFTELMQSPNLIEVPVTFLFLMVHLLSL